MQTTPGKFFYGWVIAGAAAIGVACCISVFIPSTIGLMVGPLGGDLGWTPPQMYLAISFATVTTIFVAPLIGRLVDRFGARRVIALSFLAEALIMYSFRHLGDNIYLFYLRYAAFAVFATGTTALAFSALISRWFDRRRGMALGIALAGLGVGGVFWSLGTQYLFDLVGWRDAFAYLAAGIALVVLPFMLLILRDNPESMHLSVDGARTASGLGASNKAEPQGETLREALVGRHYWLMMSAFFLMAVATYGVTLNMVPMLRGQGQTATLAATVQASMWAVLVVGRVATGWLMDRFFAPHVALVFLIPAIVGMALLAMGVSGPVAFAAAILIGLATGAEVDVLAYLTGRYFGLKHFGSIYATFFSVYAIGTSTGSYMTAAIAAQTKGYTMALWVLAALLGLAAVLLTRLPRFQVATFSATKTATNHLPAAANR